MCQPGKLLHNVLALLLLVTICGKRRCNYQEILGSYSEVILVELQNLNLTDSSDTPKGRDSCPGKAHHILRSIFVMTQRIRCQRSGSRPSDLDRPLENMEQVIVLNCSPGYLGKTVSCSDVKKIQGKKRIRIRSIKAIKALITCWQKLLSVSLHNM